MVDMLGKVFPVRKNYLMYLIEEWFEDTYLYKIQQMINRNDLSLDYITQLNWNKGELCVPPMTKPEDMETQQMMDFIKSNTLFSYKDMEEHEEEEPGWIERMYLEKLRNIERERINREDLSEEMELTEKCWKGYTQKGMKTMFGKRYPNCVKKTK
jgi:hypothetical protein